MLIMSLLGANVLSHDECHITTPIYRHKCSNRDHFHIFKPIHLKTILLDVEKPLKLVIIENHTFINPINPKNKLKNRV